MYTSQIKELDKYSILTSKTKIAGNDYRKEARISKTKLRSYRNFCDLTMELDPQPSPPAMDLS